MDQVHLQLQSINLKNCGRARETIKTNRLRYYCPTIANAGYDLQKGQKHEQKLNRKRICSVFIYVVFVAMAC